MRRAPRPLRSLSILSERSAVPSLASRLAPSSSRKTKVSCTEKARLRRIARRDTVAHDGSGLGSADVRKGASSHLKDAWIEVDPGATGEYGEKGMIKRNVKPPPTLAKHREIYFSSQVESGRAVDIPEGGVSYNPSAESHQRLLELAVEEEEERLRKEAGDEERIRQLGEVVNARRATYAGEEYAVGMAVGPGEVGAGSGDEVADERRIAKPTRRKTQAERNRALRHREAARLAELEGREKKLRKSISAIPALASTLEKREKMKGGAERLAKLARRERERLGLVGGEKVGKYRVGKGTVVVQMGEDLAETLRQVKVSDEPTGMWMIIGTLMCDGIAGR